MPCRHQASEEEKTNNTQQSRKRRDDGKNCVASSVLPHFTYNSYWIDQTYNSLVYPKL